MKAIGGNDSLYVVRKKAFKFQPSKEQIVRWTQYLKRVGRSANSASCGPGPLRPQVRN